MAWLRGAASWVLWWVSLALLWLLYQGEWNSIELYAAASAGAVSATIAVLVRAYAGPRARFERRWLVRLAGVPLSVVVEFIVVTRVLVRALIERRVPTGEFRAVPFPAGGSRPAGRGRRALATMAMGYSPNSYLVDIDEDEGLPLVHLLSPVARGEELL
jgi:multisubunit Na+/H+ antiporter MnhE subunit